MFSSLKVNQRFPFLEAFFAAGLLCVLTLAAPDLAYRTPGPEDWLVSALLFFLYLTFRLAVFVSGFWRTLAYAVLVVIILIGLEFGFRELTKRQPDMLPAFEQSAFLSKSPYTNALVSGHPLKQNASLPHAWTVWTADHSHLLRYIMKRFDVL